MGNQQGDWGITAISASASSEKRSSKDDNEDNVKAAEATADATATARRRSEQDLAASVNQPQSLTCAFGGDSRWLF